MDEFVEILIKDGSLIERYGTAVIKLYLKLDVFREKHSNYKSNNNKFYCRINT